MSPTVERLLSFDTCAVSAALDRLGWPDTTMPGVGNLTATARVAKEREVLAAMRAGATTLDLLRPRLMCSDPNIHRDRGEFTWQ
jgi:hypothetical protein